MDVQTRKKAAPETSPIRHSRPRRGRRALAVAGLGVVVVCQLGSVAAVEPVERPRVFIKTPIVGDKVRSSVKPFLDLQALTAELETALLNTRKFEVVTRQGNALAVVREEQRFAQSGLAAGNAAEAGKLENAHYTIIPTIQDFKFYRSARAVPNIPNKYTRQDSGLLEIQAQLIDTTTGGIKTTFYLKSNFGTPRQVVNSAGGSPSTTHFSAMAKKTAAQMADQLVDTVFPMLVLKRSGTQVWINRGQDGGLQEGELLNVYRPGEELVDPYTGLSLGSDETFLGQVKITRVNPKFTIATVTRTEAESSVMRGDILRKP